MNFFEPIDQQPDALERQADSLDQPIITSARNSAARENAKETRPPATKVRAKGKQKRASLVTLGVHVRPDAVHGVFMRGPEDAVQVIHTSERGRNIQAGFTPDLGGESDEGVQFSMGGFGNGSGAADLFLESEFGDLANVAAQDDVAVSGNQKSSPVVFEIKDLVDECITAKHGKPSVSFCLGTPYVDHVELVVPNEKSRKKVEAPKGDVKREKLLSLLAETYAGSFDKETAGFIPMTDLEGQQRYLGVVPSSADILLESLELLREQSGMRSIPLQSIDSEVSLLTGIVRWAIAPAEHENTAIVRVNDSDTLVILLHGEILHHQEHMLGVTTMDSPDTVCSRVLLQQDVQGVGNVHQVVVLTEHREAELMRGFAAFYPEARVTTLGEALVQRGVRPPSGQAELQVASLPAIAAGIQQLLADDKDTPFGSNNLLPKRLRRIRRKLELPITWHTLLVAVLLFFAALFFVGVYFAQLRNIRQAEQRITAFPVELTQSPQQIQAQIDSLQREYTRITGTLNTIDSLLVGSDRWSRSVSHMARAANQSGGVWVEQWSPQGNTVRFTGHATSRNQVVQFAERMSGTIDELRFSEIREISVYSYILTATVPEELPMVALHLREHAEGLDGPAPSSIDISETSFPAGQ